MSLRVWLPLTKDLRNQGLANITSSGTPVFKNSGKLGSKSLDLNTRINFSCPALNNVSTFSVAFWAKTNQDSNISGNWMDVLGLTDISISGSGGQLRWETCYTLDASTRGISAHDNPTYATVQGPSGQATVKGNWNHFCITVDPSGSGKAIEYWDGVKIGDYPANGGHLNGNFWIGETNKVNGEIQDVRIYDHCLSPMEIKEISKGLILHYPLNRGGFGQENLSDFSSIISNWIMEGLTGSNYQDDNYGNVIKLTSSSANKRMYHYVTNAWESGQIYAVSFLAKADTNDVTCDMSRSIADFTSSFSLTTKWKKYQGIITSTATSSGGTLSFRIHQSGKVVYITKIKLEKGSKVTPWCPNSADELYNKLGLNDNVEYDVSGYCNNGIRTGTFNWTSDTPKYLVSMIFPSGYNYIDCGASQLILPKDNITVNLWVNYSTWDNPISCTEGGGWNFENSSGIQFPLYISGVGYKVANSGVSTSTLQNEWHMLTGTFDKINVKIYIDGQLKAATPTGSTNEIGYANTHCYIGAEASGGTSIASASFIGKISDVRVYATALSEEDIKSLYNNSAYIDNQGNIYGAVYEEV